MTRKRQRFISLLIPLQPTLLESNMQVGLIKRLRSGSEFHHNLDAFIQLIQEQFITFSARRAQATGSCGDYYSLRSL
ncbi:MAG TPA: hypothetical protein VFV58_04460 [Blastocatellia bacterium]|jgi:hypothetical protein|nr:hypothetical protein [Blastocatellia bacterium]